MQIPYRFKKKKCRELKVEAQDHEAWKEKYIKVYIKRERDHRWCSNHRPALEQTIIFIAHIYSID